VSEGTPSPSVLSVGEPTYLSRKSLTYDEASQDGHHASFEEERKISTDTPEPMDTEVNKSEPESVSIKTEPQDDIIVPVTIKQEPEVLKEQEPELIKEADIKEEPDLKKEPEIKEEPAVENLPSFQNDSLLDKTNSIPGIKTEPPEIQVLESDTDIPSQSNVEKTDFVDNDEKEEESNKPAEVPEQLVEIPMETTSSLAVPQLIEIPMETTSSRVVETPMETTSSPAVETPMEPTSSPAIPDTVVLDTVVAEESEIKASAQSVNLEAETLESSENTCLKPEEMAEDTEADSELETESNSQSTTNFEISTSGIHVNTGLSLPSDPTCSETQHSPTYSKLSKIKLVIQQESPEITPEVLEIGSNASTPTQDELPSPPGDYS
jgi:pilus assembly protein FimV